MSKQGKEVVGQAEDCCPGLLTTPLDEGRATEPAKGCEALGDPVRLRLLSAIASRAGGEVCVCDLTPAFELSSRRSPTTSSCSEIEQRIRGLLTELLPGEA
jgi:DNA-binding transcriptional ArsR family regulator